CALRRLRRDDHLAPRHLHAARLRRDRARRRPGRCDVTQYPLRRVVDRRPRAASGVSFDKEPAPAHDQPERTAVLLVNLGTPDAPTPAAVRRYLSEFLADPRVVEIPRALWWPILHGVILRTRPAQSAAKYASIWTREGSPLANWTRLQADRLLGSL